jgi:D-glycero-alpha-D-manno-heptose-7-phosphate kinase
MIISKTPLRISFVGGGSDFPVFYREFGGAVLSASINKYIYVNVNKKFDEGIRVAYSENEEVGAINQIKHPIVRETLKYLGISGGIEITTIADVPSNGTGLGSSSTFTVGLLNALYRYQALAASKEMLAARSCDVEIRLCSSPIGKQDQYAAAFGGFNLIKFNKDETVSVRPIVLSRNVIEIFQKNILVFYTGKTRNANEILAEQSNNLSDKKIRSIIKMVDLVQVLADDLAKNDLSNVGRILHKSWLLKKGLSSKISDVEIDDWYKLALDAGASGGKILGAGAGGFLLIYAEEQYHSKIRNVLGMLKEMKVNFEFCGTQIVYTG